MPPKENISVVGCDEHKAIASACADEFITLVKDTQKMLPLDPAKTKRIRIHFLDGDGKVVAGKLIKDDSGARTKQLIIDKLTAKGFEVTDGDAASVKGKWRISRRRRTPSSCSSIRWDLRSTTRCA